MHEYDKLIKDLRYLSKFGTKYGMAVIRMRDAADAIEELSKPRWITVKSDVDPEDNFNAVPVPPHRRLIDADKLEKDIDKYIGGEESRSRFHHWVQVQRTVIPESEEAHT